VRLSSFGGYGLALAALALVVFGAIEFSPPSDATENSQIQATAMAFVVF